MMMRILIFLKFPKLGEEFLHFPVKLCYGFKNPSYSPFGFTAAPHWALMLGAKMTQRQKHETHKRQTHTLRWIDRIHKQKSCLLLQKVSGEFPSNNVSSTAQVHMLSYIGAGREFILLAESGLKPSLLFIIMKQQCLHAGTTTQGLCPDSGQNAHLQGCSS